MKDLRYPASASASNLDIYIKPPAAFTVPRTYKRTDSPAEGRVS